MGERKRRSLADILRAVDPIAGLQGTAQIMRLISAHRDPSEKPEPKESETPKAVHAPEGTKPTPVGSLVGPVGPLNVPTETTYLIPTAPTELTAVEPTEPTETTETTKIINILKGGLTETTETTEPSGPTTHYNPLLGLAPSRIVFLNHVLKHRARFDREFVSWAQVSRETGLSLSAIKRLTKDLSEKEIIRVQFDILHRKGSRVYLIEDHAKALEQVKFHYPHLGKIGFGVDQLRQIISKLEITNKSPEKLQVALERNRQLGCFFLPFPTSWHCSPTTQEVKAWRTDHGAVRRKMLIVGARMLQRGKRAV